MIATQIIKINSAKPELDKVKIAAEVLREGGLVAFPTETVYGVGANYLNKEAVDRLYEVKKRPRNKPLTIHISDIEELGKLVSEPPSLAFKLIEEFWPGPLTIVLKSKFGGTIGLRMPRNEIALILIRESRIPIVAPSANISGEPPPKTFGKVIEVLNGFVELIIDGGETEMGIESTVVDLTVSPLKVLREGAISKEQLTKIKTLNPKL